MAEKLHAYTRTYEGDRPSSRTKDLVDLVLIAELAAVDAATLRDAIETTFAVRGTHPVPNALPAPPQDWSIPFGHLAHAVGIPAGLSAAHAAASDLLDPILTDEIHNGTWDTDNRAWRHERRSR